MFPKIKGGSSGAKKSTKGKQQHDVSKSREAMRGSLEEEAPLWPGRALIQGVLTLGPAEQDQLVEIIQGYTNFMKKEINQDRAFWTALEKEHFQRSHHIFKLQGIEESLKATLKICSSPINTRLQPASARAELENQDTNIRYLEEQSQALRAQIADGKASTTVVLRQARQQNAELAAELHSSQAAIQQQAKEIKRAQAELRRTQMAIARKHPNLGVYAALAAEEELFKQAEEQAALEASQHRRPQPATRPQAAASHQTTSSQQPGSTTACPHTAAAAQTGAAPQSSCAPDAAESESRVMLCLLVQPP